MQERVKNWGFEHSFVEIDGELYLERRILYLAGFTFRWHKFWRGDDARASHSHPWAFWTFPLQGYFENVYRLGEFERTQYVSAFRWHYRGRHFEHRVTGGERFPFSTFVITGRRQQVWGFYPEPGKFVPYWDWK